MFQDGQVRELLSHPVVRGDTHTSAGEAKRDTD